MNSKPIESNDNWVFLLGAGFSAPYGCPVMNNFMEAARRNYFTNREQAPEDFLVGCYKALLDFQAQCLRSSWAFNRNWENIEELYTQADLLRLTNQPGAEDLCTQIAWAIWDVYRQAGERNYYPLPGIVMQLVAKGLRPVFVTTNYDIVIEKELSTLQTIPSYYPGFVKDGTNVLETDREWEPPKDGIPIIKLHGSVNWFRSASSALKWFVIPYRETPGDTGWLHAQNFSRDEFLKQVTEQIGPYQGLAPAIIPPMLGKASVSDVIARQWDQAIEAFRLARQIWIIGYSFPQTDTFMKRLLSQGIQDNPNLQKIVIIDQQLFTDWQSRLMDLFPPIMWNTRVQFFSVNSDIALRSISPQLHKGQGWDVLIAQQSDSHITEKRMEKRRLDPTIIV